VFQVDGFESSLAHGGGVRTVSPPPTGSSAAEANSLYQMRNMTLNYSAAYGQQDSYGQSASSGSAFAGGVGMVGGAPSQPLAPPNLMASEEIRVDCVQLTTNGRYVVTGSIYGPPQVWDMKVGIY